MKIIIDKITDKGKLVDPSGNRMIAINDTIKQCGGICPRIRQMFNLIRASLSCTHLNEYCFINSDKYYFILEDGPLSEKRAIRAIKLGLVIDGRYDGD